MAASTSDGMVTVRPSIFLTMLFPDIQHDTSGIVGMRAYRRAKGSLPVQSMVSVYPSLFLEIAIKIDIAFPFL
jgi:hypothetical protein